MTLKRIIKNYLNILNNNSQYKLCNSLHEMWNVMILPDGILFSPGLNYQIQLYFLTSLQCQTVSYTEPWLVRTKTSKGAKWSGNDNRSLFGEYVVFNIWLIFELSWNADGLSNTHACLPLSFLTFGQLWFS